MREENVKGQVRQFYDQVGWQQDQEGLYQNAQYEDLRPVSQEYITRCHMRVKRHLAPSGDYLLDAGSGPVQYAAYLTYSEDYKRRVCMDLSIIALKEARLRLGEKGFYIVADISKLPFKHDAFDGIVSLHTIHHLPLEEKVGTYQGLYQCLKPGRVMVTVDGWTHVPLTPVLRLLMRIANKLKPAPPVLQKGAECTQIVENISHSKDSPDGTFVLKNDAIWFKNALKGYLPFKILVWRSVSVSFLRSVIRPEWGGRFWLKVLYRLEELFPKYLGEKGQYPLIVIEKPKDQI